MSHRLTLSYAAHLINSIMQRTGYVIKNVRHLPNHSYLGLRNLPIKTILDVGANYGQFAQAIRKIFPVAHIFSFEPIPIAFARLCEVASQHQNWTPINIALGEKRETKMINFHVDHSSSSSFLTGTKVAELLIPETQNQEIIPVTCETLDGWSATEGNATSRPMLIKLDVQGFEMQVISGGLKTFATADAVIAEVIMESLYTGQTKFSELVVLLEQCGLVFQGMLDHGLDPHGYVVSGDALFLRRI